MPRQSSASGASVWIILSVAVTVMFGVFGFVWSIIQGQINEFKTDFIKYQSDARWQYATKDYVNGKIDGIKDEEATYRKYVERKPGP